MSSSSAELNPFNSAQQSSTQKIIFTNCGKKQPLSQQRHPRKIAHKVLDVIADQPCNKLKDLFSGTLDA